MGKTYAIFKRELSNYFLTPVAPIFIVVFLSLSGFKCGGQPYADD